VRRFLRRVVLPLLVFGVVAGVLVLIGASTRPPEPPGPTTPVTCSGRVMDRSDSCEVVKYAGDRRYTTSYDADGLRRSGLDDATVAYENAQEAYRGTRWTWTAAAIFAGLVGVVWAAGGAVGVVTAARRERRDRSRA